jgi:hypothetical protein
MVASTGASIVAQAKTAKAQTKALATQAQANTVEIKQAASGELFDEMRASRREQARVRAAAGEAGLSLESGSIEGLLFDSAQQGNLQGGRTLANMESRFASNDAATASAASQIQKPTILGAGLQLAAAGASAWSGVQSAKIGVATSKATAAKSVGA